MLSPLDEGRWGGCRAGASMGAIRGEVEMTGFGWDTTRDPCDDAVRAAVGQLRIALRELRGATRAGRGRGRARRAP